MIDAIPNEMLDSDIAILGRKGTGKSYTAKGIVERLLDMGRRVLILDHLGVKALRDACIADVVSGQIGFTREFVDLAKGRA